MSILNSQYTDIPVFISSNSFTGDLNVVRDVGAVRQSLKNIVLHNFGERSFDYEFGTSLYQDLFENLTLEIKIDIQSRVLNAINLYEPRVVIRDILIEDTSDPNTVSIKISYILANQNVPDEIEIQLSRTR